MSWTLEIPSDSIEIPRRRSAPKHRCTAVPSNARPLFEGLDEDQPAIEDRRADDWLQVAAALFLRLHQR